MSEAAPEPEAPPDATAVPRPPATSTDEMWRRIRRIIVVIGVASIVGFFGAVWVSQRALFAPRQLDLWGHAYTADGNAQTLQTGGTPPWPNEPISYADVVKRDPTPVIIHQTSGPLLLGMRLVAMPKPPVPAHTVYLQVGSDSYVPYIWAVCCEEEW